MNRSRSLLASALLLAAASWASAATLPPHPLLRILIVSDEANPHSLSDAELTQPGDISSALLAPGSGLNLDPAVDGVVEVATNDLNMATALLSEEQIEAIRIQKQREKDLGLRDDDE